MRARPPWEGERAWSAISHFGRNLASRMTHELYDQCVAPMQREFDRSVAWFANQTRDTEQKIWDNKLGIDRFFGTNIATADRHSSRLEFAQVGIPFGPGGVMSGTSRVLSAVNRVFCNTSALKPAQKLAFNAKHFIDPHTIRFTQPTVSQNFSSGGEINDLAAGLRAGKIKITDIPIIRIVEFDGKIYTLDNRRLVAFQNAGVRRIPIRRVSFKDPNIEEEFFRKYNPVNKGANIVIIPNALMRSEATEILRQYGKIR